MHPRDVLLGAQAGQLVLPVCDHYSGVEARMVKSLELQRDFVQEFGVCVFDVTLDCEDGAPVGGELDHAVMVADLVNSAGAASNLIASSSHRRVGVRLHAVDHPAFEADVRTVVGGAASSLSYVMLPKIESISQVERARVLIDAATPDLVSPIPLHVLIESPLAVHHSFEIASHPRVQSVSFGLMDFVSAHGGAIPSSAMSVASSALAQAVDQFHHPLVVQAKVAVASACHAYGKVPSHCVVTELKDAALLETSARYASRSLGYTRMWSIHPTQIRAILRAFAPEANEVGLAADVIAAGHEKSWAPIALAGRLHDRASYRYFWQVLERAFRTGVPLPGAARHFFSDTPLAF